MKLLYWLGSTLKEMPEDVQDAFGHALFLAQLGEKHRAAKPLKGFSGAGVLEIVEDGRGSTYRAVYTVRFAEAIYVLHVFQKKSKSGLATPEPIPLISFCRFSGSFEPIFDSKLGGHIDHQYMAPQF